MMDRLWSPWRMSYITGDDKKPDCVFCPPAEPSSGDSTQADLIVARGPLCYVILNLYPYNNGHLMVVPTRHFASLTDATTDELSAVATWVRHSEAALREAYRPQGINVGINLGPAAGAGIAGHLHVHLVPRWSGDSNFMSVIGETRVLPETLSDTAARLRPVFQRLTAQDLDLTAHSST